MSVSTKFLRLLLPALAVSLLASCSNTPAGVNSNAPATVVADRNAAAAIEGQHPMSLQWISWDYFGMVDVRRMGKTYWISGRQDSKVNQDYAQIKGRISQIDSQGFTLDGQVITKVYHINNGQPVVRTGPLRFQLYGDRRFWRMTSMKNPYGPTDYVDVFYDINSARANPNGATL